MINPADLSYAMFLAEDEKACQRAIVKARRYHEGHQYAALTDRMREFLGIHPGPQSSTTGGMWAYKDDYISPFVMNVSRIVVNAVTERLIVAGFDTDEPSEETDAATGHPQPLKTPVADWAWKLWLDNRMDAKADEAQTGCIRDGEYFIIVDWDKDNQRARFTAHPRYTDAQDCEGDGFGCKAFYPDDDDSQPMLYATKRWTASSIDMNGKRTTDQRCNVYYPDRIEQLILKGGAWTEYAPPIAWRTTGQPLGIAVIHMRNVERRPEAWDAFPLQDALNKGLVDLVAAADLTAFRTGVAFGWYPTEDGREPEADGSNAIRLSPGAIFGTMNKDGRLEWNEGADLNTLILPIQNLVLWMSMVTDTPIARFTTTKQIAAEGTLKQQEGPLLGKIRKRQALIGNAWEDCLKLALQLENAFGQGGLDPLVEVSTRWERAETRDELAERQGLLIEKQLNVPDPVIWKKLGYSPSEIDAMLDQVEQAAAADMQRQVQIAQATKPMIQNGNGVPMKGMN